MSLMDVSKIFTLLQPKEEDEQDGEQSRALIQAVRSDDVTLLSHLLDQESYRKCINVRSGWGVPVTPLRTAASLGHLECLELLLEHGAEIDSLDVKAQTPLFTAVSGKHLECVVALLKAGADPNGSPHNNCSPAFTAARQGDPDVLRELLRFGADVDVKTRAPDWAPNATACRGPLYTSAVYENLDCFKLLLLYGANPNYNCTDRNMLDRIKEPKTVMEACLRHGCRAEFTQLLIDFGADVYLPVLNVDEVAKNQEAAVLLLKERVCPKNLQSQSRLAIRRFLPLVDKEPAIDRLDIPLPLKDYLNHRET